MSVMDHYFIKRRSRWVKDLEFYVRNKFRPHIWLSELLYEKGDLQELLKHKYLKNQYDLGQAQKKP